MSVTKDEFMGDRKNNTQVQNGQETLSRVLDGIGTFDFDTVGCSIKLSRETRVNKN